MVTGSNDVFETSIDGDERITDGDGNTTDGSMEEETEDNIFKFSTLIALFSEKTSIITDKKTRLSCFNVKTNCFI